MTRKNFTLTTIKQRLEHCKWQCEWTEDGKRCSTIVTKGRFEADHHLEDRLGGKPTFENCKILCTDHHKIKTAQNSGLIAKVRRQEAKDLRVVPPSPNPVAQRPKPERVSKLPVPGVTALARRIREG
jgi:5-methylcytosine-specific restriction protein A